VTTTFSGTWSSRKLCQTQDCEDSSTCLEWLNGGENDSELEVKKEANFGTLKELGWSVESDREDVNVYEPVQPSVSGSSDSETTSELQCEAATFVAQEGSTDSDQSSSAKSTPESYTQLSPQQLSQSGLSLPSSDPAKWKDLTGTDKEVIDSNGPPQIPSSFP